MKIIAKFLLIMILFCCACSHTASIRHKNNNFHNSNLTVDNRDLKERTYNDGLCLQLSRNAIIRVDLKNIANFTQPVMINQYQNFWPNRNDIHPWALCNISF
jgi:hypothetical protein